MTALAIELAEYALGVRSLLMNFDEAKERLLDGLRHGDVSAGGRPGNIREADSAPVPLLTWQWSSIRFSETDYGKPTARSVSSIEFWHDVQLRASEIISLFPPVNYADESVALIADDRSPDEVEAATYSVKQTMASQLNCERWLVGLMAASPTERPSVTKKEHLQQAKERFNVSTRMFETAWKGALAKTGAQWDRPGAPTKKPEPH